MGFLDEMRAEGFEQGHAEGRDSGQAELLLRQIQLKFGALPTAVEARVRGGSSEDRALWAERILTADTLTAVLGEP